MQLVPWDVNVTLCVSRVTGSAEGGCAVVENFLSWNLSQVSVVWAFWIWNVCSKNKFILSFRSKW